MTKTKSKTTTQQITVGDCVAFMNAMSAESTQLVVADPPYNRKVAYDTIKDNKTRKEYMDWTEEWITAAHRILDRQGAMWIFAPEEWVSEVDIFAKSQLKMTKRRHLTWAFTFGQAAQKNFTQATCHMLYLTKAKTKFYWDDTHLRVPSARQLVYNDKRANPDGKLPDSVWMLLEAQLAPYMTPDRETWLVSRICGTFKERGAHSPNQIPVTVMERIVRALCPVGGLVVDPFAGTCSSGVACAMHGRNWRGYDLSPTCVTKGRARLLKVSGKG